MRIALDQARRGTAKGQSPFGACIVLNGSVVACAHNTVFDTCDATAHAEINAIRHACQSMRTVDLRDCTIYSTTEPCPMCFSAIHWARIRRIVFGAGIEDARRAGFSELPISNKAMQEQSGSHVQIVGGVLYKECAELLAGYRGGTY
jgi:guanine deaminase